MPMAVLPFMKITWTVYAGVDPFLYYAVYRRPRLGWEAAIESHSPALFWRMREKAGLTIQDESVNNLDGTVATGVTLDQASLDTTDSYEDRAADFNSSAGFVSRADNAAIQNIWGAGGSAVVRFKADTVGENAEGGFILDKGVWQLHLRDALSGAARLRFAHTFSGVDGAWDTTAREITFGVPYLVIVTYNSDATTNDPTIYLKNLQSGAVSTLTVGAGLTEVTTPTLTRDTDVGSVFHVGNRAANDRTFDGIIDEAALYATALSASSVSYLQGSAGAQEDEGWTRIAKITDQNYARYDDYNISGGRTYEYTVTVGATVSGTTLESDKQVPPSTSSLSFTGLRVHDVADPTQYATFRADNLSVQVEQDIEYIRARGRQQPTAQVGEFEFAKISVGGVIHTHADREEWTALRNLISRQRAHASILCLRSGNHPERYFTQAAPVHRGDRVGLFDMRADFNEVFYDEAVP